MTRLPLFTPISLTNNREMIVDKIFKITKGRSRDVIEWIERWSRDQEIPGSNLAVSISFLINQNI